MFCRNCGKELEDDAKFCPECGASTEAKKVTSNSRENKNDTANTLSLFSSKSVCSLISVGTSILFVFLLFKSWFKIPALDDFYDIIDVSSHSGKFTILNIITPLFDILGNDVVPGKYKFLYTVTILVIGGLWAISIWYFAKYAYKRLINNTVVCSKGNENYNTYYSAIGIFEKGLNFVIALWGVSLISTLIINGAIKDETYGYCSHTIGLTGTAYFIGIVAIISRVIIVKKLGEEKNANSTFAQ